MVNERTNNAAQAAAIDVPGSMAELARRIGVRLGSVQKYPALNRVPAEQVIPIERATGNTSRAIGATNGVRLCLRFMSALVSSMIIVPILQSGANKFAAVVDL